MQSYIRAVYESSTERGHLCPCSTVRDIRTYATDLIKKRRPKLSNKQVIEATNNTIANAGQVLQEKQSDPSWTAVAVKKEKEKIKKFIAATLEELMKPPGSYAAFRADLRISSTPKTTEEAKDKNTSKCSTSTKVNISPASLPHKMVVNSRIPILRRESNSFTTPDRKIQPKVASESKFFTGTIDYKDGKAVISTPGDKQQTNIQEDDEYFIQQELESIDLNSSVWLTAESHGFADPAESPMNHGFNSAESSITEEDLMKIEAEQNAAKVLEDSLEYIADTPKRDDDLPMRIKQLGQRISDINASLLEASMRHAKRKRADSLSTIHQLIDKMVPEGTPEQIRKRSNSLKNQLRPTNTTPVTAQHCLEPHLPIVKTPTVLMFNGKCRNLLETFQNKAKVMKMHLEEEAAKLNNSMNKQRIDSMFPRMPKYNTPYPRHQGNGRKRADSLNFDSLESTYDSLYTPTSELPMEESRPKYERKRVTSLNLDAKQEDAELEIKESAHERIAPKPDGIIYQNQTVDREYKMPKSQDSTSRIIRISNKIDELTERVQRMKNNLFIDKTR